jgi:DNA-binding NtrC family response regulator
VSAPVRFLFVDDDEQILRAVGRILLREGFELHFTADPFRTIAMIEELRIEVVVCDHMMPGITGLKLLTDVGERFPHVVRVLASGSHDRDATGARDAGTLRFIDKPWLADDLRRELHDIEKAVLALRA